MPRPEKTTLDFIQIDCFDKTTFKRLNRKFKKEGRLFWIDLLRLLGRTEWYVLDLSDEEILEDIMIDELDISTDKGIEILNQLAKWGAICKETWEIHKNVWCQNLIDRHIEVFNKRRKIPVNPFKAVVSEPQTQVIGNNRTVIGVSDTEMQQSKVKERKVKESKVDDDVLSDIDILLKNYLSNRRLVIAFCKNHKLEPEELELKLKKFNAHLLETDQHAKKDKDYKSHFKNWFLKQKGIEGKNLGSKNGNR